MKRAVVALGAVLLFVLVLPYVGLTMGAGKVALAGAIAIALIESVGLAALLWPQERSSLTDDDPVTGQ
jgi:hypothetical protein